MEQRFKQANKEARLSLMLTFIYLLAWLITAYFLPSSIGITGLPLWFEISCILVPIGFILACWLVIKFKFKNMSLDANPDK